MAPELITTINAVLAKAPEWVRADLCSREAAARQRAEEALAAMIAAALGAGDGLEGSSLS